MNPNSWLAPHAGGGHELFQRYVAGPNDYTFSPSGRGEERHDVTVAVRLVHKPRAAGIRCGGHLLSPSRHVAEGMETMTRPLRAGGEPGSYAFKTRSPNGGAWLLTSPPKVQASKRPSPEKSLSKAKD